MWRNSGVKSFPVGNLFLDRLLPPQVANSGSLSADTKTLPGKTNAPGSVARVEDCYKLCRSLAAGCIRIRRPGNDVFITVGLVAVGAGLIDRQHLGIGEQAEGECVASGKVAAED
ncbi:hypothetical protein RBB81_14070 [Tunturibacter gelidoferens]|uniref:Uncharacterized protein n=1 Tax=Tunturiibacter gelidiferens TaxID=3069689 RepID=A0AAU7YVQ1_9BACT